MQANGSDVTNILHQKTLRLLYIYEILWIIMTNGGNLISWLYFIYLTIYLAQMTYKQVQPLWINYLAS